MGGSHENRLLAPAIGNSNLEGLSLRSDDLTGGTIESGMEPAIGDARIDLQVYALTRLVVLDRTLWG